MKAFLHCRRCLAELPEGTSPADFARLSVSIDDDGLRVFCERHQLAVGPVFTPEKLAEYMGEEHHCEHPSHQ